MINYRKVQEIKKRPVRHQGDDSRDDFRMSEDPVEMAFSEVFSWAIFVYPGNAIPFTDSAGGMWWL